MERIMRLALGTDVNALRPAGVGILIMGDDGGRVILEAGNHDEGLAPKRSKGSNASEHHAETEFADKIQTFQKTVIYKELLATREACEYWRNLYEKHLKEIPGISSVLPSLPTGEGGRSPNIDDVKLVLEDFNRHLTEEIRKKKGLEVKIIELNKIISQKPTAEETLSKSTLENTAPESSEISSEIYSLKQLTSSQASLLAELQIERQDLAALNASLVEKLRRVPEEVFEDPRPYKVLLEDFKTVREDLQTLQRNLRFLQDEWTSRSSDKRRFIVESAEDARIYFQEKLRPLVDSLESEVSRLRRDRDSMRALYEKTNSQLQSLSKENSNLRRLLSEVEKHCKTLESITNRQEESAKSTLAPGLQDGDGDSPATASLKNEISSLYAELEALALAFEEIKTQNVSLIKSLNEKEEVITRVQNEKLKAEFALTQARKDLEVQVQKASHMEKVSIERLEMIEQKVFNHQKASEESEQRLHQRLLNQEELSSKYLNVSNEFRALRSRSDLCHQLEGQIVENAKMIERLKFEKSTIVTELKSCQERISRLLDQGGRSGQDPQELEMYRKLMRCNSCHLRDKNAVILKCMHCFCRQCLDTRIETRQRKCPNCGEAFGAGDVRTIYL